MLGRPENVSYNLYEGQYVIPSNTVKMIFEVQVLPKIRNIFGLRVPIQIVRPNNYFLQTKDQMR